VVTSGDEVVSPDTALANLLPHQIRNSNAPQLHALLHRLGADPVESIHLPDDRQATIDVLQRAVAQFDLVITVGGVSAGERDHFPTAFDVCGLNRSLQGASIQPGRPIFVGIAPSGAIVIGLPGNPVSVLACACLFIWPMVRVMLGLSADLPWLQVELAQPVKPNPHRRAFRPAMIQPDGRAVVPSWSGSGDLAHTAPTHGLLELPVQDQAVLHGARLRFLAWP
jgi:molybdopterin molybdotransferase